MERTDAVKSLCIDTAKALKGSARRSCMVRTVQARGSGGQRRAERELGWSRVTMRTGTPAMVRGFTCLEALAARGRKRVDAPLPHLRTALAAIVESQRQADPPCRPTRLDTRLPAAQGRQQLIAPQGYTAQAVPTVAPIPTQRHALGYSPKKGAHSQPPQKSQKPRRSATT